jgi:predicted nucleic acid-binding protein
MTATVFVDTNVLVYARDASEPGKQSAAAEWVRQLWVEQRGRTSFQVLNEFYVTVTRKLSPGLQREDAWQDVSALLAWEPQETNRDVFTRAADIERRHKISWWDSLIVAAAQVQACSVLLSEDFQDGMAFDDTIVVNPFTTGVAEAPAAYYAAPVKPASRHRRRGRPSRHPASRPTTGD